MHKYLIIIFIILINSKLAIGEIKQAPLLKMDSTAQGLSDGIQAFEDLNKNARSRESINKVVINKKPRLRKIYNKRLIEKPGIKGRIETKFVIDEYGKVIYCAIIKSSINDTIFESRIISEIESWEFEAIDKPGDVTEVIYPFVFNSIDSFAAIGCVFGLLSLLLLIPIVAK